MTTRTTLAIALSLVAAGCGGGNTNNTAADLKPAGDMAVECSGTFTGALYGMYRPCTISMAVTDNDESLRLVPVGYEGQPPSMVALNVTVKPKFAIEDYSLTTVENVLMEIVAQSNSSIFQIDTTADAGAPPQGAALDLNITALPTQPTGFAEWNDTTIHGTLNATLPLDPNGPGMPGDTVVVSATF